MSSNILRKRNVGNKKDDLINDSLYSTDNDNDDNNSQEINLKETSSDLNSSLIRNLLTWNQIFHSSNRMSPEKIYATSNIAAFTGLLSLVKYDIFCQKYKKHVFQFLDEFYIFFVFSLD